jgi:hypothetical protein
MLNRVENKQDHHVGMYVALAHHGRGAMEVAQTPIDRLTLRPTQP